MPIFKIKLFGALKHQFESAEIQFQTSSDFLTVMDFEAKLKEEFPKFNKLNNYKLAVNNELLEDGKAIINYLDEIALLPPYAGG